MTNFLGRIIFIIFLSLSCHVDAKTYKDISITVPKNIECLQSLDPADTYSDVGLEFIANAYEQLVSYDVDNREKIFGVLATRWDISNDGKTYIFYIRPNVQFSTGNILTARDAEFSLQRAVIMGKRPAKILTQFGFTKENVGEKITAIDTYKLKIEFDYAPPKELFLRCLASSVASILDKQKLVDSCILGDLGYQWARTHSAGTGPYRFSYWRANEKLIMVRNIKYRGRKPDINKVVFKHLDSGSQQEELLMKKKIDLALKNSVSLKYRKNGSANLIRKTEILKSTLCYLGLNQNNVYLKDPKIREALKYLIDYEGIVNNIKDYSAIVHQSFIPRGYGCDVENKYTLNIKKARELLADSPYPEGFKISIHINDNNKNAMTVARTLRKNFSLVDIDLTIKKKCTFDLFNDYRKRSHDIILCGWGVDYHDIHNYALAFIKSSTDKKDSGFSLAWRNNWKDDSMVKLADKASVITNTQQRNKIYKKLQIMHQKHSPFIFIYQKQDVFLYKSNLSNITISPISESINYAKIKAL